MWAQRMSINIYQLLIIADLIRICCSSLYILGKWQFQVTCSQDPRFKLSCNDSIVPLKPFAPAAVVVVAAAAVVVAAVLVVVVLVVVVEVVVVVVLVLVLVVVVVVVVVLVVVVEGGGVVVVVVVHTKAYN